MATIHPSPAPTPAAATAPAPPEPTGTRWTPGRVFALAAASLLLLASLGIVIGGVVAAWADDALRDGGYVMTDSELLTTPTYAITSEPLEVHVDEAAGFVPETLLGRAKLTATSPDGSELFLGLAPTAEADRYLSGVANDRVTDLDVGPAYTRTDGGPPATPPADADIWRAASTGSGEVTITWPVEDGDWTLVAMNADGTSGVEADVAAGATLPVLDWVAPVLLSIGGAGLVLAVVTLALTLRSGGRPAPSRAGIP